MRHRSPLDEPAHDDHRRIDGQPHMAEPAVNPVMPMRNTRRLPKAGREATPDDKQHAHGQGVASPEPL